MNNDEAPLFVGVSFKDEELDEVKADNIVKQLLDSNLDREDDFLILDKIDDIYMSRKIILKISSKYLKLQGIIKNYIEDVKNITKGE